jgi:hypothetical protein
MGPASLGSVWETGVWPLTGPITPGGDVPLGPMTPSVIRPHRISRRTRLAALAAPVFLIAGLAACSADSAPDPTDATTSAPAPTQTTDAASPSPTRLVAVLCDAATEETVEVITEALLPDHTISQVVDVRADDEAQHAILGFVEGPGVYVLAQWVGDTLELTNLVSADENAERVSTAPLKSDFDQATQDLLDNTVKCYTSLFGPEE